MRLLALHNTWGLGISRERVRGNAGLKTRVLCGVFKRSGGTLRKLAAGALPPSFHYPYSREETGWFSTK